LYTCATLVRSFGSFCFHWVAENRMFLGFSDFAIVLLDKGQTFRLGLSRWDTHPAEWNIKSGDTLSTFHTDVSRIALVDSRLLINSGWPCICERKFVPLSFSPLFLSLASQHCIFTHSDGARRNAGRPAPRRFSRSRPVVYFFKRAHAPPYTSHAYSRIRKTCTRRRTPPYDRRPPPLRIWSRERRRYFSPRANRKNKECRANCRWSQM